MCLYPKLIKNRRYLPNKKNGGFPPRCEDKRMLYVPVGCGKCIECKKQKSREWQVRLAEEIKSHKYNAFVTLSFSNEELEKLNSEIGQDECNATATLAVRRFCERWRKKYGHSITHWLITELGHNNTERIHLHGILFTDNKEELESLQSIWKYGNVWAGWVNLKTINYITKYVTKVDVDHKNYEPVILCSAGIGHNYINRTDIRNIYKYRPHKTREFYTFTNGQICNLPIYFRNHLFDEQTRLKLWSDRLDLQKIYVKGTPYDISTEKGMQTYYRVLEEQQQMNIQMGYGDRSEEWKKKDYNTRLKDLNNYRKLANLKKK